MWVAELNRPASTHSPDTVRYDPVRRKVSAANHISGPRCADRNPFICQKAVSIAVCHQLGAGFGVGIGVKPVQHVGFPIAPGPLAVLIDLVRCHIEEAPYTAGLPHTLQNMDRSHHIGGIGAHRVPIALPDDGLRRQMKHNFRFCGVKSAPQGLQVPHITVDGVHFFLQSDDSAQAQFLGRQRKARYLRPGHAQNRAQPRTLEARMPCDKNFFIPIKIQNHVYHTRHGAFPLFHRSSSQILSRCVSMHCQNPSCL